MMKKYVVLLGLAVASVACADPFVAEQALSASALNASLNAKANAADLPPNVKALGAGRGGDDLAIFNAGAASAGADGQVVVPAGAYVLSGKTAAATWLVDARAIFSGAGSLGGRIVKLGNGGAWGKATKIGAPAAWLEAERVSTEANADLVVLSSIGQGAVLGGSRTSDFSAAGSMGSIGVQGWVINDNAGAVQSGYAGYFEGRRKPGAGTTHGVEIDIVNQDSGTVPNHPYSMGATGSTPALWLASGGEIAATPASLALGIINNGASFDKGIVFGRTAIRGTDGITGTGTAISFAKGHSLQWYGSGGVGIGYINNTVATASKATNLNFSDAGAAITGDSGQVLALIPNVTSAVNHLVSNASTAGNNVSLSAAGVDANINITLSPKGSGSVAIGNGYLDVINSHVWSNIAGATLPGNATTTGVSLIGWNRSAGGGETNFVNAQGAGGSGGFDWRTWNGSTDTKIMGLSASGTISPTGGYALGNMLVSATAPTISSGFGTGATVASSNGTATFRINVGTGDAASSGVIGLPAATNGWNCFAQSPVQPMLGRRSRPPAQPLRSL